MAATGEPSVICRNRELTDRGRGIRFTVRRHGEAVPAFVVRFGGAVHAYLNRCAHRMLELDWNAGDFFDAFGMYLLCATHGARYAPVSGLCIGGPCARAGLVKLAVIEEDGDVCLEPEDDVHLIATDGMT